MALLGTFTDVGISKSIEAGNDEAFFVFPEEFGVSDQAGALDPSRTGANLGLFFQAAISSRVVVDQNTIKIISTVPPGIIPEGTTKDILEIYLFGKDTSNNEFLLALAQPTTSIEYDPTRSVTLEIEMSLTNIDLTANFVFSFTQATEIAEHNDDPNAHPEWVEEFNRAGMFVPAGGVPFAFAGQSYDKFAEFDGSKATAATTGPTVTFTATFNGNEINNEDLVFDGIETVDDVRATFNAANFPFTVEHDGAGTEVPGAQTITLIAGQYLVNESDLVYKAADGLYKQALADGTIASQVAGVASIANRLVMTAGFIDLTTAITIGDNVFLSETVPGGFTSSDTAIRVGFVLDDDTIFFKVTEQFEGLFQGVDAVVSNITGFSFFPTTQQAIDAVPNNGFILVDKLESLQFVLDPGGKTLNFIFNGSSKGWTKSPGINEIQDITFDSVPDAGTWRIEWNGQETTDLAFNASAGTIQTAFNLLAGHNGVTITGNYSIGFTIDYSSDFTNLPEPTFLDPGQKEIHRFSFGNVPNNGTWQLHHDGNITANHAFNDSAGDLETLLEALASITDVTVSGSFATQVFDIEFEQLSPQNEIRVIVSSLEIDVPQDNTTINGIDPFTALSVSSVLAAASGNVATDVNTTYRSMSFTPSTGGDVAIVEIFLSVTGAPTGNVVLEIRDDNAGTPGSTILATSNTIDVTTLNPSPPERFTFAIPATLTGSVRHHLVLNTSGATLSGGNTVDWDFVTNGLASEGSSTSTDGGSSWGGLDTVTDFKHEVFISVLPNVTQEGKFPANNLTFAASPVVITVAETQQGSGLGPTTAILLDAPDSTFTGRGTIDGFEIGIDLNEQTGTRIDMSFINTTKPIKSEDLLPGVDFNTAGSLGFVEDQENQLRILEHPTDKNRVIVTPADALLAHGGDKILQQNGLRLVFGGAQIDFSTGEIFELDGSTPLGTDFTPPTVVVGDFRWISFAVIPDTIIGNRIIGKLLATIASADGASPSAAEAAPFAPGSIGAVVVQEFPGQFEISKIITVNDVASNLGGTFFEIDSPATAYYVWYDVDNGSGDPAPGGRTGIEVDISANDVSSVIAAATRAAIDGLGDFVATIADNLVTVTNTAVGSVPDIVDGSAPTGFALSTFQQGQDTGGVTPIDQTFIEQLGTGSGSGGDNEVNDLLDRPELYSYTTVADVSDSLDGTFFLAFDDVGSVGFWIDVDDSGTTIPAGAAAADRAIEITTIVTDDDADTVAGKVATAIDGDSKFSAAAVLNIVTVTDASVGERSRATAGDTGFTVISIVRGGSGLSGALDGSNPTFSMTFLPKNKASINVFLDALKVPDHDWVLSGKDVVFIPEAIPVIGQDLEVAYVADPIDFIT